METKQRKCEAILGPDDVCDKAASVITESGTAYCDSHNRWAIEQGDTEARRPAWAEGSYELPRPEAPRDYELTCANLTATILQKVSTTRLPEGLLVRVAFIGLQRWIEAHERWERLESDGHQKRAPLWLERSEADKLVAMLAGQRGAEARLIRQEIERLFEA